MMPRLAAIWSDRDLAEVTRGVNGLFTAIEFRHEGRLILVLYLAVPVGDLQRSLWPLFPENEEGGSTDAGSATPRTDAQGI